MKFTQISSDHGNVYALGEDGKVYELKRFDVPVDENNKDVGSQWRSGYGWEEVAYSEEYIKSDTLPF